MLVLSLCSTGTLASELLAQTVWSGASRVILKVLVQMQSDNLRSHEVLVQIQEQKVHASFLYFLEGLDNILQELWCML